MASVAVWLNWSVLTGDPDQRAISFERWKRLTAFNAGHTLPGTPELAKLSDRLAARGLKTGAPVFLRIFKREFELELWMLKDGKFELFSSYPICRWSGRLGPKLRQGDRQAPEGFYSVSAAQLNPKSRWHRAFNLGFPNAYDRSLKRSGSFLMVHGGCSSIGCFAMTNPAIDEIWELVTAALKGGQSRFQVQVFPFRMAEENLASRAASPHAPFWMNLKQGYDLFEQSRVPPRITACNRRYAFEPGGANYDGSGPIAPRCAPAKSKT